MVSLMHSGSVSFQSFAIGVRQSHLMQHHIPGLNVYMKEHVNYKDVRPTERGKLVQILFQPSIRVKRETASKRIRGFIYSYIIIIFITITIIINFGV